MQWCVSHRFDPRGAALADRHYSRRRVGSPQFVRPASCVVLLTPDADALWVSVRQQFVRHAWPGCWECALFRNESDRLSSSLIVEAVAATRAQWGDPPPNGFITMVNADRVRSKRDPGYCYLMAGWRKVGTTAVSGHIVLQLDPADFPPAAAASGAQGAFF